MLKTIKKFFCWLFRKKEVEAPLFFRDPQENQRRRMQIAKGMLTFCNGLVIT